MASPFACSCISVTNCIFMLLRYIYLYVPYNHCIARPVAEVPARWSFQEVLAEKMEMPEGLSDIQESEGHQIFLTSPSAVAVLLFIPFLNFLCLKG